ncbi:HNH endonuclease [Rhodoferax sp.]|uniref:HNH endonuclease n=1 Tax=Rhodoferax sp. TaxID=50421 RepID=UPI00374C9CE2
MSNSIAATLESLKPRRSRMIMDLVAEAGIDVVPWTMRQDGTAVRNPRANPSYCYEWAFGGNGQPAVVCVWHTSATVSDGLIFYEDNLRQHALALDRIAITKENPPHVKSRARDQAARARRFDSLLQRAYRTRQPVRVVLLDGASRAEEELGWERSEVKFRELDVDSWHMHAYSDDTGLLRLVRGVSLPEPVASAPVMPLPGFVDQFSLPQAPGRHDTSGSAINRSAVVRNAVLKRANGLCEYCGEPGFKTASGSIYLETHHVIALSDDGPDQEWNVVGVCPTDHRRAHFAEARVALQAVFLDLLIKKHPAAASVLEKISMARKTSPEKTSTTST